MNKQITKREARKLFKDGKDFLIGGRCSDGTGAWWSARQLEKRDFDILCANFVYRYCHGEGRILYPTFYIE